MEEVFDEAGEDGGDHAEGEHVESYGEEDEGRGGTAAFGWMRGEGFCGGDEFGLGKERVGLIRGGPGRVLSGFGHVCRVLWG